MQVYNFHQRVLDMGYTLLQRAAINKNQAQSIKKCRKHLQHFFIFEREQTLADNIASQNKSS